MALPSLDSLKGKTVAHLLGMLLLRQGPNGAPLETFDYQAGDVADTVVLDATQRLTWVSVSAGAGGATVAIGGGDVIPVAAGMPFDQEIVGSAYGADVEIVGDVDAFFVSWVG